MKSLFVILCAAVWLTSCVVANVEQQEAYRSVVPGLTVGKTTVGGVYRKLEIDTPEIDNKDQVRDAIVSGLLWAAAALAAVGSAGLVAAIYLRSELVGVASGVSYCLSVVAVVGAYWFVYIMWILAALAILALGIIVYLAGNMLKDKKVISELVSTGEKLKHATSWDDQLKVELLNGQSHATHKAVVKAKLARGKRQAKEAAKAKLSKILK